MRCPQLTGTLCLVTRSMLKVFGVDLKIIWPTIISFVPNVLIKHNTKYRPRQYPKHIRSLLTRKAAIWRKFKHVYSHDLFVKYRDMAQACKTAILEFDIERERTILDANNLGAFYKFINNKVGGNHGVGPLSYNNQIFTDDYGKATILNQYFEYVFVSDNGLLPDFPMRTCESISDIEISYSIVLNTVR